MEIAIIAHDWKKVEMVQFLNKNKSILLREKIKIVANEADINMVIRICDVHNVPLATNEATAQLFLLALDEIN